MDPAPQHLAQWLGKEVLYNSTQGRTELQVIALRADGAALLAGSLAQFHDKLPWIPASRWVPEEAKSRGRSRSRAKSRARSRSRASRSAKPTRHRRRRFDKPEAERSRKSSESRSILYVRKGEEAAESIRSELEAFGDLVGYYETKWWARAKYGTTAEAQNCLSTAKVPACEISWAS